MDCQDNIVSLAAYRLRGIRRRFNLANLTGNEDLMWLVRQEAAVFPAGVDLPEEIMREAMSIRDQAREFLRDDHKTKIS